MIKLVFILAFAVLLFNKANRIVVFPEHLKDTAIAKLVESDSLVMYQCSVIPIKEQQLTDINGAIISVKSKEKFISLTEKYVVKLFNEQYSLKHFTSSETYYPNKKFAYLKLTEKDYWQFNLTKDTVLPITDVLLIAAYQKSCVPLTEYDFKVVENNSPQLIVNGKRISEQFRFTQKTTLSKTLSVFKNEKK